MIVVAANAASDAPAAAARPRRRWTVLLVAIGAIVAYAAMLGAEGNGWTPLVFVLFGCVTMPILAEVLSRRRLSARAWLGRFTAMAIVAVISFGAAKFSTRTDPTVAFRTALGIDPPAGIRDLDARRQWYDGQTLVVLFSAGQGQLNAVLKARAYEQALPIDSLDAPGHPSDEARRQQVLLWANAPFVDPKWMMPAMPMVDPLRWQFVNTAALGIYSPTSVRLIWDEVTGRAIVVAWFD
jgi:hypothetical protein